MSDIGNGNDGGDDGLWPIPSVDPELLSKAYAIMQRDHLKLHDAGVLAGGDLEAILDDIQVNLRLDGPTTVAVFRRVCAGMNYVADREEADGLPAPARPFDDLIFCTAVARCPVVHDAPSEEEAGADTFDPAEFASALEEATRR
jgi:hypothetical protein